MTDVAALSGVTVIYKTLAEPVTALDGVSIGFKAGTSTAIVGRSGSGKTTLVSVLALLRRPTSGEVKLGGQLMSTLSPNELSRLRSRSIGIAFQSFHLEDSLTATENVMLPLAFQQRVSRKLAKRRALDVLERLDIPELAVRKPNEMSGGQRQRVAIGRALVVEPALFLADEPTGNLDENTANSVAETILSLGTQFETAVVLVTHDNAIAGLADRHFELTKGRLSQQRRRGPARTTKPKGRSTRASRKPRVPK